MATYIMNQNGDWWEYTPGEKFYVLNYADIPKDYIEDLALPDHWNFEPCSDEFIEFGKEVTLNITEEKK